MVKKIIVLSTLTSLVYLLPCHPVFGGDNLEKKLHNMMTQKDKGQKVFADDASRTEIYNYVIANENVSVKDFKKLRLSGTASDVALQDLEKKYGANSDNYQKRITNERDRRVFQTASKLRKKMIYKEFYACNSDDEDKATASIKKVDVIRTRISEMLRKERRSQDSDDIIKLDEQIHDECKYHPVNYSLLTSYRIRGMREKFNSLMLRMIKEDQVDFDYLYVDLDKINDEFVVQYWFLLQHVNGHGATMILSKDDVKTIADSLLTKHSVIFNLNNSYYFNQSTGLPDEYLIRDAVQCLVNVSTWLREYKLDDLNEQFVDTFFKDKEVLNVLSGYDQFKDFREYLSQRESKL